MNLEWKFVFSLIFHSFWSDLSDHSKSSLNSLIFLNIFFIFYRVWIHSFSTERTIIQPFQTIGRITPHFAVRAHVQETRKCGASACATHTLLVILQTTKYWIESTVYCPHKYGNLLPPCSITRKVHKIIQILFHIHIKNIIHWYYKGHVTCKFWRAVYCKIISPCITINPLRHCFSIGEIIIQYSIEYNLYCLSFFLSFFFISSFFFFFFFLHRNTYRQSIYEDRCVYKVTLINADTVCCYSYVFLRYCEFNSIQFQFISIFLNNTKHTVYMEIKSV